MKTEKDEQSMKRISMNKDGLTEYCLKNGIKKLALFGSVLRNDFGPESDIDILVEFEPGHVPDLFTFVRMQDEMSAFFSNRRIDLVTYKALRGENRKAEILKTAEVFYESAA